MLGGSLHHSLHFIIIIPFFNCFLILLVLPPPFLFFSQAEVTAQVMPKSGGKRVVYECWWEIKSSYQFGAKLMIKCFILLILLSFSLSSKEPDVEGEALMEILRTLNDTGGRITDWNDHFVSPCFSWSHVTCRNGNVMSLMLDSNGFSGKLSPSLTKLKFLVSLELQNNNLSGALPDFIGSMVHLQSLNLANNKFSGSIPVNWGHLSNLKHLDLSSNDLAGKIPMQLFSVATFKMHTNFRGLPGHFIASIFNKLKNILIGLSLLEHVSLVALVWSSLVCQALLYQICLTVSTSRSKLRVVVTSASCGAFVLLLIGALFLFRYHQLHRRKHDVFVDVAGEDDRKVSFGQLRRFSWRELQLATNNFSESNIIGQGGFGKVYKGVLSDNTKVAVKRLADYYSPGGEAAFHREVQLISVAVHRNLLQLVGFCTTSSERILVYPFMQNLSVAYRLREKTDVFGYGITLLELVTGERAIDFSRLEEEEDVLLLDHIKKLLRENRLSDIVDKNLKNYDSKEVEIVVQVALLCTQSSPEDRLTMAEVVKMLEGVGLAERWAEWEQLEQVRHQGFSLMSQQFAWAEESSLDQEAIQLSKAR
ncbi:hypothetical protein Pint_27502 [Pistacia integerrima]|uniref:Uncharacterized protein n=1 Tax=Pistacia integerrima TaxID=434235 RepID=A0ACC0YV80_9ROSI|nr:hypothetical protein Pint_27502 [Pistacia integerrima]